jgi:hypothetical protein
LDRRGTSAVAHPTYEIYSIQTSSFSARIRVFCPEGRIDNASASLEEHEGVHFEDFLVLAYKKGWNVCFLYSLDENKRKIPLAAEVPLGFRLPKELA